MIGPLIHRSVIGNRQGHDVRDILQLSYAGKRRFRYLGAMTTAPAFVSAGVKTVPDMRLLTAMLLALDLGAST